QLEPLLQARVHAMQVRAIEAVALDQRSIGQQPIGGAGDAVVRPDDAGGRRRTEAKDVEAGGGRHLAVVREEIQPAQLEASRQLPDAVDRRAIALVAVEEMLVDEERIER